MTPGCAWNAQLPFTWEMMGLLAACDHLSPGRLRQLPDGSPQELGMQSAYSHCDLLKHGSDPVGKSYEATAATPCLRAMSRYLSLGFKAFWSLVASFLPASCSCPTTAPKRH